MQTQLLNPLTRKLISITCLIVLLLNGCTLSLLENPITNSATATSGVPAGPTSTPQPSAPVTFDVTLPSPLLAGEVLYLSVVDEITGLGLNPVNYAMQGMDALHYAVTIPFTMNSVVKYRFMRQGTLPTLEDDSADKAVRYRMYFVTGPGAVDDVVSSWADSLFSSPFGRASGKIVDSSTGNPLTNILVAAGGQQTLTDSNGDFILEGLPVGTHNMVAYAIDGAYQTFQQGLRIEAGNTTPVSLALIKSTMQNVVFTVTVPNKNFSNLPIRLAGNLYQLGDTFGDLQGGMSSVAARMPVLTPLADGRYTATLSLPVGADIRYKYTLGDGFWNAEHSTDGSFLVRQLLVPASQDAVQVQDTVQTWQVGANSPILFELNVPASTPVGDVISIQFNPYGWTEPIPMWPRGNNQWVYQLYSPLNMLGNFAYRFCRNDQCGVADEMLSGPGQPGRPISASLVPQDLQDNVTAWSWFQASAPAVLPSQSVTPRADGFWTGMEFLPNQDPTWQNWMSLAIQDVKGAQANMVVLRPSWSVSRTNPFVFSPVPGADPLWVDTIDTINHVHAAAMNVALYPSVNLPTDSANWWKSAPRDATWWESWFDMYTRFVEYHADLAQNSGVQVLILGGNWVAPALPGGQVNGAGSGVPVDAETRWDAIIADVRQRYTGQILWALPLPGGLASAPAFASNLDGIYLLWSAPLSGITVDDLTASAGELLDMEIKPFQVALGKPIILAAAYASTDNSASLTLPSSEVFQPKASQGSVNLQAQADVYQALLLAVNQRDWLTGFVSRGYYPPAELQDASASVHGKPAEDELRYWFAGFLGKMQ